MNAFTDEDTERLTAQIKEAEGFRLAAYRCASGALTIGYGHNCAAAPAPGVNRVGDRITQDRAEALLRSDLADAMRAVRRALPWALSLSAPRQAVLYDMAFNMGLGLPGRSGLLSFRNTLRLIEQGAYAAASRNMLASKWAVQVKSRAARLAVQMETGEWQ